MKPKQTLSLALGLLFSTSVFSGETKQPSSHPVNSIDNGNDKLSNTEIIDIARQAYIYALPLIFTDITRQVASIPNNIFSYSHKFPDHTSKLVVAPNNDTNYSSAFLDLGKEPIIIDIPDTKERYYVVPLMDAWTNVFASFGKRNTGTKAQRYIITGPHWKGKLPSDLKVVKAPTDLVWIIGRIQVNSPEDQQSFVSKTQDQFTLTPLSKWGKKEKTTPVNEITTYKTPLPQIDAVKNKEYNVVQAIKNIPIETFFNYLNELLVKNPPLPDDAPVIKDFAKIGIKSGASFKIDGYTKELQDSLQNIPQQTFKAFDEGNTKGFSGINPSSGAKLGDYKTDYVSRALVAYKGLGALTPEEATYISFNEDQDKQPLNGKDGYVIHFDQGKLPPSTAFWSLTMYDKDRYLVANPIKRYAIGDRNNLKYNSDGSLDIYIQHVHPGVDKENNWLPAPPETFNVILRIYVPKESYLKDHTTWVTPQIKKVDASL